jgi:PIN domain
VIYIDSSVALARLLFEPRAPPLEFWRAPLVSSRLLEYEVWNRVHAYRLAASHGDSARLLLTGIELLEMDRRVLARALQPWPIAIRTLDALHLATLEHLRSQGGSVELASYDNRLLAAARALDIVAAEL